MYSFLRKYINYKKKLLGSGRSDLRDPGGGGEEGVGLLREGQVRRRARERGTQGKP